MEKDEKELLEKFRKLTPVNRLNALSNVFVALSVQEATKRQYGLDREPPAQAGKSA